MTMRRPRLTRVEKILKQARENPSQTCYDPKQIDLFDYEKRQAFATVDAAIAKVECPN
jgi:hypothetical protein